MSVATALKQKIRYVLRPVLSMSTEELWEERDSLEGFGRRRRTKSEHKRHAEIILELELRAKQDRILKKRR